MVQICLRLGSFAVSSGNVAIPFQPIVAHQSQKLALVASIAVGIQFTAHYCTHQSPVDQSPHHADMEVWSEGGGLSSGTWMWKGR